jgi:hypothetical protein
VDNSAGGLASGTGGAGSSLVVGRRWELSLYPAAGEAGGCWRVPPVEGSAAGVSEPARVAEEAARRARGMIRRYCAANRLNRLGTLTYAGAGCHDPAEVRADAGVFFRRLRGELGGEALPYVWVPEWHPGGHGLHLHFAVGRYVPQPLIRETWGRGIVHIKLLGDRPVGSGSLEESRLAARYLAKYAAKAVDADRPAGLHRYEVGQGFKPQAVKCQGRTADEAIGQASALMGSEPSQVWHSSRADGWQGPPACWAAWDG